MSETMQIRLCCIFGWVQVCSWAAVCAVWARTATHHHQHVAGVVCVCAVLLREYLHGTEPCFCPHVGSAVSCNTTTLWNSSLNTNNLAMPVVSSLQPWLSFSSQTQQMSIWPKRGLIACHVPSKLTDTWVTLYETASKSCVEHYYTGWIVLFKKSGQKSVLILKVAYFCFSKFPVCTLGSASGKSTTFLPFQKIRLQILSQFSLAHMTSATQQWDQPKH